MGSTHKSAEDIIAQLGLRRHPEGGYYVETDRQTLEVPTPFSNNVLRPLSTSIYYLLTKDSQSGFIHMNKSVTYHLHHIGRAEYTLITPGNPPHIEKKVIGPGDSNETRMLFVGSGVWKMSQLLDGEEYSLISEVVVPGFVWEDHKYLTMKGLQELFADDEESVSQFAPHVITQENLKN
ncbi:duf985 domain protein [Moniliophthora roreri MCA 2997]|uniref:Duf985 domain protein n=1 Tax=Moniliophthora roreri (strain MCA 2997) TaxID=1381753 RepID=V2X6X0_MONRO|nr:duf985 domain protein [Moniliophthora roreri MCA 2997]